MNLPYIWISLGESKDVLHIYMYIYTYIWVYIHTQLIRKYTGNKIWVIVHKKLRDLILTLRFRISIMPLGEFQSLWASVFLSVVQNCSGCSTWNLIIEPENPVSTKNTDFGIWRALIQDLGVITLAALLYFGQMS